MKNGLQCCLIFLQQHIREKIVLVSRSASLTTTSTVNWGAYVALEAPLTELCNEVYDMTRWYDMVDT